jgi:hypothetical protein
MHDEGRAAAAAAARATASQTVAPPHDAPPPPVEPLPRPRTLRGVLRWASRNAAETRAGIIDPRRSQAINDALTTIRYVLDKLELAATQREHDQQLRKLKMLKGQDDRQR